MQSGGLKQNGNSAKLPNRVELAPIKSDEISGLTLNIGSGHKRHIFTESFACPAQNVAPFLLAEKIHVAGVHVDRIHQAGLLRNAQMPLKRLDGNFSFCFKWQQRRSDALHLSPKAYARDQTFDGAWLMS